jgi:hypothetical protein
MFAACEHRSRIWDSPWTRCVADGDNIAIAYTIVGTQDGEFGGVALTGKEDSRAGFRSLDFGTMNGRAVGQRGTVGNLPANRHSGDIGPSPRQALRHSPRH